MRWVWYYITHRAQLGKFRPIKIIQEQSIYMKIILISLLLFIVQLTGCSKYHYKSEQCELSVVTWSNIDAGSIDLVDCDVMGSATGKQNEVLQKALEAGIAAAKAAQ